MGISGNFEDGPIGERSYACRCIERGIKNGKITPKEAQHLRDQQATISVERELAKREGKITPRERAEEQHDLNALNKDIYRKKHNKRRVYQ